MRDITTIPTEVWDCIITDACTDRGYTGRSLALANKFFHSQSLSNRFPSVRLTSLTDVEKFLSFLEAQTTACKPKICHLFLAFLDETEPIGSSSLDYRRGPSPATDAAIREWNERFVSSMTKLFAISAPTLRTLCVVAQKLPIRLPAFPYGPLPVLEELSTHQSLDLFLPGAYAYEHMWNSNFALQLPALRRFHIIEYPSSDPLDLRIFRRLAQYQPPNLTHVRVSDLGAPDRDFQCDLWTAVGIPYVPRTVFWQPTFELPSSLQAAPLPNLRSIVLHGSSPLNTGPCGTEYFYWMEFCDQVRTAVPRLVKQVRDIDVSVVALNMPPRRKWHWHERLFDDWVSRIEGGTGCWVESEDEEAKLAAKLEVYHEDDPSPPEMVDWPLPDSDDDL